MTCRIIKTDYGFEQFFEDNISIDEMNQWVRDSIKILASCPKGKDFNVLAHMENLKPISQEVKHILEAGQVHYSKAGLFRSAVICPTLLMMMQAKNAAKASGISEFEQYFLVNKKDEALAWAKSKREK